MQIKKSGIPIGVPLFFIVLTGLVYDFKACVGNQGLGDSDAILCLVVLQYGCNYTGQSQGRTVQSVAELSLLLAGLAVTALKTVGLIGVKVRY